MKHSILLLSLLVSGLLLTGCGRTENSATSNIIKVDAGASEEAQLRQLNIAAGSYMEMTGKFPPDFQALVDKKFLAQIPTPPAGKKFVLNAPAREVQLVPQ